MVIWRQAPGGETSTKKIDVARVKQSHQYDDEKRQEEKGGDNILRTLEENDEAVQRLRILNARYTYEWIHCILKSALPQH